MIVKRRVFSKLTYQELEEAVKGARFVSDVLRNLGFRVDEARNNKKLKNVLLEHGVGHDHISFGQGSHWRHLKGIRKSSFDAYSQKPNARSYHLKRYLLREGGIEEICEDCGLGPMWNGKKIVLQLDHKNGDRTDNRRDNLRLLCPNCHSQTDTYGGKNLRGRKTLKSKSTELANGRR